MTSAISSGSARRPVGICCANLASPSSVLPRRGIAVFVTRGDRSTGVEVVSKPVGGVLTFPPDWPALLFGDIDQELTPRRPK